MEILEDIRYRIQNFFDSNVTRDVFLRGEQYFRDGLVFKPTIDPISNEISFPVLGSKMYYVQFEIDLEVHDLFSDEFCDCPYTGLGACKHVVAAALWILENWSYVATKMILKQPESSAKPIERAATKPHKKKQQSEWSIKNFTQFDTLGLEASHQGRFWNNLELEIIDIRLDSKDIFKVDLGFSSVYSDSVTENYALTISRKKNDLNISCTCRNKGNYFCFHAYSFFDVLIHEKKMDVFVEPSAKELEAEGKKTLQKYGFSPDLNWKDYFNQDFVANKRTLTPKENIANLISPLDWKFQGAEVVFTGNPEEELDVRLDAEASKIYEIGFYFRFGEYDGDFHFEPFVARENKKGIPMSIGYKQYYEVRYHDHVSKRDSDFTLLTASNAVEGDFRSHDSDKKITYFSRFAEIVADHPYVFYWKCTNYNHFRKKDLSPVQFHSKPPRLKYILTEKDDFITIGVFFSLFGKDISINDVVIEMVHPHFIKTNDHLFFIPNQQDTKHFESAKMLVDKMISTKMLPELFEKYLTHALRKSDVEFKNFKAYTVSNQVLTAVSKEIYLSEVGNFVLFRPFIRYENGYLLNALSQESQWEVDNHKILKTEQDNTLAEEFRDELHTLHPEFKNQFNRTDYLHITYNELLRNNLFLDIFATFEKNGYKVFGVRELKGLKVNPYPGKVVYSVKSGIDWFEVDAKIIFGDEEVSIDQLKKRFKPGSDYIELANGSHGMIPKEWLKKLERLFRHGEMKDDKFLVSNKKFNIVDELFDELDDQTAELIQDKRNKLLSFDKMQKYPLPKGIKGTLRHYQEDGFQWLCFLDEFRWGGILADDMGLGKTLQIITFLKYVISKNKQTNLIIVPTSLLFNWENEIEKFAPSLKVHFYYGSQRIKSTDDFDKYDIVFTSYGHALSDVTLLKEYAFNYVILDESQAIKNPASKRFKAVRLLKANNRIAMTGTPIENNTFDLYAQMAFLNPGFLGSAKGFKADFAKAIDNDRDEIKAAELQRLIKPFVLRRTKTQVATELPDKTEEVLYCEMDKSQQKIYDAFRNEYRQRLIEKIDEEGMNKARFAVLEGLTKLRQICDTPEILPGEEKYSGKSVKTDLLMMHIKEKTANHKILIFSQFVKMLHVIEHRIKEEGISYEYLDGKSTTKQRQASVEHFQNDDSCRVFLISLKAGGTGLNLMAADYVYLVDPWWNPAVENQAIDRCYRIGQDKKVIAYRMICKNTVEEKIMELQKKKKAIAGDIVTTDEGVLKKLKKDDLIGLFD